MVHDTSQLTAGILEAHTLPAIAVQFDGDEIRCDRIVQELQKVLPQLGAIVLEAHYRRRTGDGGRTVAEQRLAIAAETGRGWTTELHPGQWLVIWSHRGRITDVSRLEEPMGRALFRPVAEVLRIGAPLALPEAPDA